MTLTLRGALRLRPFDESNDVTRGQTFDGKGGMPIRSASALAVVAAFLGLAQLHALVLVYYAGVILADDAIMGLMNWYVSERGRGLNILFAVSLGVIGLHRQSRALSRSGAVLARIRPLSVDRDQGPGDRLQDNQRRCLAHCVSNHMPVSVCHVRWLPAAAQLT